MHVKLLWAIIIFLALLVLAQAGYIYKQRASAGEGSAGLVSRPGAYPERSPDAQWEELEKWRG